MKKILIAAAIFLTALLLLAFNAKHVSSLFAEPPVRIPILIYHSVDHKGGRFSVSPEDFRSHLERLYKAGYVTVPLADVLNKKEYLKKQKSIVLRFDDSRPSQCNYLLDKNGTPSIDPESAVGIILDFYKEHPSFGKNALFALIAHVGFGQEPFIKEKMLFLLNHGMELANHGYYHVRITNYSPEEIDNNFGKAMAYWHTILGAEAVKT